MIPIYIILGSAGSGRREVLCDLVENGLDKNSGTVSVFIEEREEPSPVDERLNALEKSEILFWHWEDSQPIQAKKWSASTSAAFFLTQGLACPVEQLETLKRWMDDNSFVPARIFTVVNCGLLENNPGLRPWYEACIHFSDLVLLNKRMGVSNKWIQEYQDYFTKACYPCLFEPVKKGRLRNPIAALFPETRRLSHFFDNDYVDGDEFIPGLDEIVIEDEFVRSEGEIDCVGTTGDPYMARLSNGQRTKKIPDICSVLADSSGSKVQTC